MLSPRKDCWSVRMTGMPASARHTGVWGQCGHNNDTANTMDVPPATAASSPRYTPGCASHSAMISFKQAPSRALFAVTTCFPLTHSQATQAARELQPIGRNPRTPKCTHLLIASVTTVFASVTPPMTSTTTWMRSSFKMAAGTREGGITTPVGLRALGYHTHRPYPP